MERITPSPSAARAGRTATRRGRRRQRTDCNMSKTGWDRVSSSGVFLVGGVRRSRRFVSAPVYNRPRRAVTGERRDHHLGPGRGVCKLRRRSIMHSRQRIARRSLLAGLLALLVLPVGAFAQRAARRATLEESLRQATVDGKNEMLLRQIKGGIDAEQVKGVRHLRNLTRRALV